MSFASPPEARWFEDYVPGSVHEFGSIAVDEDEVLAFGRRFDPQTFHTDAATAARTEYGGLIASGWHTAALMMRLYADHYCRTWPRSSRPAWTSCAGCCPCAPETRCPSA